MKAPRKSSTPISSIELRPRKVSSVCCGTAEYVNGLDDASLDEVVDDSWDPPVTRGVRIVSTIDDAAQHVGQAAYVRGLVDEWSGRY